MDERGAYFLGFQKDKWNGSQPGNIGSIRELTIIILKFSQSIRQAHIYYFVKQEKSGTGLL